MVAVVALSVTQVVILCAVLVLFGVALYASCRSCLTRHKRAVRGRRWVEIEAP